MMTDDQLFAELRTFFLDKLLPPDCYSEHERPRIHRIFRAIGDYLAREVEAIERRKDPETAEGLIEDMRGWLFSVIRADIERFTVEELEAATQLCERCKAQIIHGRKNDDAGRIPSPSQN